MFRPRYIAIRVTPRSRGLTDEEILDETDADPVVLLIPRDGYRARLQQQPEVAAAVLDAVERGSLAVVLALSGGHLTGADLLDSA